MIDPDRPDFANTPASEHRPGGDFVPAAVDAAPVVSVVTPFYRPGRLFHETARSLLGQSLQQWEWLIVNDASTDRESLSALDAYRDRDARIRVIDHERNRGLPASRNTGIRAARSGLVYLLDDDDLIEPTALEKTLWFLVSHPDLAFANGWSVGFGAEEYLWPRGFGRAAEFLERNVVSGRALLRRSAWQRAGGFDESLTDGFEDWDFWLRCADRGLWGGTIPEYLDWYRRRADHGDRWKNLESSERMASFRAGLRDRYPRLYAGSFPTVDRPDPAGTASVPEELPCANELAGGAPRLLMLVPWLTVGGADSFNLDVVELLTRRGWRITVAATRDGDCSWEPAFAAHTPDVLVLRRFLASRDLPRFLRYLIGSRRPDVVLVTNSELGYLLLPYLRTHCPEPCYVDLCHIEEEEWRGGGYPRYASGLQDCLDMNLVTSRHVAEWMKRRGADGDRIEVLTTNVDPARWRPDAAARARLRSEWDVSDDEPVLLYAGRLCAQKQPRVLAGTLRELARRGVAFRAVIAGDGEERPELEAFLNGHDLSERVAVVGAVSRERMRELMSASDVFFLPSKWEGIAVSLYEAMATGLAVVGADVGGQSELVTPECGILLPRADEDTEVERYAQALGGLLCDPERRRRLGIAARARVEEGFRLDQMVDRLLALFERARERASVTPRLRLPPALATEWAVQALEQVRIERRADGLWAEHGDQRGTIGELREFIHAEAAGKRWLETQRARFQRIAAERARTIDELRAWIDSQAEGKQWIDRERERLQSLADDRARTIEELRLWIDTQAEGKSWLEEQYRSWVRTAEAREEIIRDQQRWIRALEEGKQWLEERLDQNPVEARVEPGRPLGSWRALLRGSGAR